MKFRDLNLNEDILKALEKLEYNEVLPVQEQVIPHLLEYSKIPWEYSSFLYFTTFF